MYCADKGRKRAFFANTFGVLSQKLLPSRMRNGEEILPKETPQYIDAAKRKKHRPARKKKNNLQSEKRNSKKSRLNCKNSQIISN